jgi:hypothetical protein
MVASPLEVPDLECPTNLVPMVVIQLLGPSSVPILRRIAKIE